MKTRTTIGLTALGVVGGFVAGVYFGTREDGKVKDFMSKVTDSISGLKKKGQEAMSECTSCGNEDGPKFDEVL